MAMREIVRLQIYHRCRAVHHHHHVHRHSTNHLQLLLHLWSPSNPQLWSPSILQLRCPPSQPVLHFWDYCWRASIAAAAATTAAWPTIFESRATAPRSTSSCSNTASNNKLICNGRTRIGLCLITLHAHHLRRRHTQSRPAHPPLLAAVDVAAMAVVLEAMLGAQGVEEKVTVMAGARRRARMLPWMQTRPRGPAQARPRGPAMPSA